MMSKDTGRTNYIQGMLSDKVRQMVEKRFGAKVRYPQECEALAVAIREATHESLGTTTLKRMLGFVGGVSRARRSSLDIIARYLGYGDYDLLAKDLDEDAEISDFRTVENITSEDLMEREQIQLTYEPHRMLRLEYLGQNLYIVKESKGSKLQKGDRLLIAGFYVGFELVISDVERSGRHLGSYIAGKQGGLTSIEIID